MQVYGANIRIYNEACDACKKSCSTVVRQLRINRSISDKAYNVTFGAAKPLLRLIM